MLSTIYRIGFFISSYAPLYILLMILNIEYIDSVDDFINFITFDDYRISIFFCLMIFLLGVSYLSIRKILKIEYNEYHEFKGFQKIEDNLLNYIVTYLVPLLSLDLTKLENIVMNICLFIIFGYIYVKTNVMYLNPTFLLFNFNIFITQDNKKIISNLRLNKLKELENHRIKSFKLSEDVFLIREKDIQIFED